MRNAGLEEAQAGIKTAGRNINNLRYAGDTTLMAESKEELKSLLMKVKEENERVGLKFNKSRFDARYWMLGARALGRPSGMVWGGRREEGSGWGTHVYLWWIHFDIWQN